jgi:hypothetical protein
VVIRRGLVGITQQPAGDRWLAFVHTRAAPAGLALAGETN